jgi:hypothetical protein
MIDDQQGGAVNGEGDGDVIPVAGTSLVGGPLQSLASLASFAFIC